MLRSSILTHSKQTLVEGPMYPSTLRECQGTKKIGVTEKTTRGLNSWFRTWAKLTNDLSTAKEWMQALWVVNKKGLAYQLGEAW